MDALKIKFTAELEPVPFKRVMQNGKRRFNDRRYSDFKDILAHVAKIYVRAPLKGNIKISVDFFKLKPKNISSRLWGDLDNHLKSVLDALNGIAYLDDCQVVQISGSKNFGEPKIMITLEAVE
ncbi:MAG: RusA family crossover junction endodeoxyribonuclease [Clostridia bacterium]|nr:RusA family crossover junction endodeoxyribonuclease [Clostridia bacterium]